MTGVKYKYGFFLIAMCLFTWPLNAQVKANALPEIVTTIQKQLLAAPGISYDYTIHQKNPDGSKNSLQGKMFKVKDTYIESNTEQLTISDKQWYYRVNHTNKTVTIINLTRLKGASKKKKDLPENNIIIPDSILAKYGKITIGGNNAITKVTVVFNNLLIKSLYLEYDNNKKLPLLYKVEMNKFDGITKGNYEEKYTKEVFEAKNFSVKPDTRSYALSDYFSYEKGTIKLKKYTNYKLIQ